MKFPSLPLCLGHVLLAGLPTWAAAQGATTPVVLPELPGASAAAPAPVASGAPGARPAPRLRSPAETGIGATAPGDLKPERAVTPQLTVPFGKKPLPLSRAHRPGDRAVAPTGRNGVDDDAARCKAEVDPQARSDCRARLAQPPGRPADR